MTVIRFSTKSGQMTGKLCSSKKLDDQYYMAIGDNGKRYLLTDDEIIKKEECADAREVCPEVQNVEKKKKRGRPRKPRRLE